MKWNDKGFLISKSRYNENSVIAEFFTLNYGKVTGIIFGATSKKIKSYLEIGNLLHVNYSTNSPDRIGSFKVEILKVNTPFFFESKKKLLCIISTLNLIKNLTVENQSNQDLFSLISDFFEIIRLNNWLQKYILWELNFFKVVGYNLNLNDFVKLEKNNEKKIYFVYSNNHKKIIPNFLIEKNFIENNKENLLDGIKILNDFLDKSILKPNNIKISKERLDFLNNI
tara:strand:+ start:400 stop:1077 length:678 start_codon:yes stop_codon:yes gene_type:complete